MRLISRAGSWGWGWVVQAWEAADTKIADYFACMGETPDDRN